MTEPQPQPRHTLVGLYQLYDRKAELVLGPIMAHRNPGPAIRDFHSLLGNPQTQPGQYPEDFELRHVGDQDPMSGEIFGTIEDAGYKIIATGAAWIEQRNAAAQGNLSLAG